MNEIQIQITINESDVELFKKIIDLKIDHYGTLEHLINEYTDLIELHK